MRRASRFNRLYFIKLLAQLANGHLGCRLRKRLIVFIWRSARMRRALGFAGVGEAMLWAR